MTKYVLGYEKEGKFVILYESNNKRVILLMVKKYMTTKGDEIRIRKRY